MKKLYVESILPLAPEAAWEVFESEEFRTRLEAETGLKSTIVSQSSDGGVETKVHRYASGTDLPAVAAKALGTKRLQYDQENRFDRAANKMVWSVKLPVMNDRIRVEGTTLIVAQGNGSKRTVDGEIEVKVRLIGGQIEKAVVGEFEKSMRKAVDIAQQLMIERS